jgi:hypothetical protein
MQGSKHSRASQWSTYPHNQASCIKVLSAIWEDRSEPPSHRRFTVKSQVERCSGVRRLYCISSVGRGNDGPIFKHHQILIHAEMSSNTKNTVLLLSGSSEFYFWSYSLSSGEKEATDSGGNRGSGDLKATVSREKVGTFQTRT